MADRMEVEAKVVVTGDNKSKNNKSAVNKDAVKNSQVVAENVKEASNSAEKIKSSLTTAFNKSAIVGWAKLLKDTTNWLIEKSKAQSEYIENLNMMNVAFGDSAEKAGKYLDTLVNATGFDQSGLTRQLGIFRQISDAMGYTNDVADLLSTNLSKLSVDVASLYNVSMDKAGKALESAITGQVRSIRSLTGADITLATLQQEALRLGIEKTTNEMSRAEKTILIYLSLERQLANANGDAARTINSVSNQTKIFRDQIVTLGRNIGGFLIPILRTVLPILNGILMVINTIASSLLGLFGIDAKTIANEFGVASSGFEGLEDDLGGVSSAAEEAKKQLRGFDKLNNLSTPSKSSGSGGVGGGIGGIDNKLLESLDEYNLHLDEMKNKAEKIRDRILEWLGFSKQVNGEWKWSAKDLLTNMVKSWNKLNGFGKIFVGLGVGIAIKKIYDWAKKLIDLIKNSKLVSGIKTIVDMIGEKGLLKTIGELMNKYPKLTKALGAGFVFASLLEFYQVLKDIKTIVEDGISWDNFLKVLEDALETVGLLVAGIGFFTTNPVAVVTGFSLIGAGIVTGFIDKVIFGKTELEKFREEANSDIWHDLAVYQSIKDLSGELENYIGQNGEVQKSDENRVNYILNQMNEAFGTEYKLIDGLIYNNGELVSSYQDVEKEVDIYMAKIKAQMILERYAEKYTEALEKKEEKQKLVNKENENYEEILKYIDDREKKLLENGKLDEEQQKRITQARETAATNHKKELEKLDEKYKEYIELFEQYSGLQEDVFNNNLQGIKTRTDEIIGSQVEVSKEALKETKEVAEKTKTEINKILYGDVNQGYDLGKNLASGINKGMEENLKKGYDINVRATAGVGNYTNAKVRAEGGFVNSGDIFVANENNRPEYVGSFGHQTAVANTDQIVDGIAIGVTKAMMAVGANKDNKVVIEAKGDASGLLDFITFEQKKKDRQYGL